MGDIKAKVDGGVISANRHSSVGAATSHVVEKAAIAARVIIAVKDLLLQDGMESCYVADILGQMALTL